MSPVVLFLAVGLIATVRSISVWRAKDVEDPVLRSPDWWPYSRLAWLRGVRGSALPGLVLLALVAARAAVEENSGSDAHALDVLNILIVVTLFLLIPLVTFAGFPRLLVPPALRDHESWET